MLEYMLWLPIKLSDAKKIEDDTIYAMRATASDIIF